MFRRLLNIAVYALLGAAVTYASIGMLAGDVYRLLILLAALALGTAFTAWHVSRSRPFQITCVAVSLVSSLLLVDQLSYLHWRHRLESSIQTMRQAVMVPTPSLTAQLPSGATRYWLEPGRVFALVFEPPGLAWTYYLERSSRPGMWLVRSTSHLAAALVLDEYSSDEALEFVLPHTPFVIGVMTCETIPACGEREKGTWIIYVDHGSRG